LVGFQRKLTEHGLAPLLRTQATTLQVNVGKVCNQACLHCHVEAGPKRTEAMPADVAQRIIELMDSSEALQTVDITGGAPELNEHFRRMVDAAWRRGLTVIDRCNLTVMSEPGQEDLAQFLAARGVNIVASLPCYTQSNVDKQRGKGVFGRSIDALRRLNELGYGRPGMGLVLDLVYNPVGAFLPPAQQALERDYKERLLADFGVEFNRLLTITNMPIKRFAEQLHREGKTAEYMGLLVDNFNPTTVDGLMCRDMLSVGWDGRLFDCDFNQMLEIDLGAKVPTVWDLESLDDLTGLAIATASHCFGCTAGAGSSCGGALG
jgi:radical SAM/Cys-rich protein